MRLGLVAILFSVSLVGAPGDARLTLPRGLNFVRYCSAMFGEAPYVVKLGDPRLTPFLGYYDNVDAGDLEAIMALFSDDAIYARNENQFLGIGAVRGFFVERLSRLKGKHTLLGASIKGNQYFFYGTFKGTNFGEPTEVDFLDYWVLDREGKVYYRQSWTSKAV